MLHVDNVWFAYDGNPVLLGISAALARGGMLGILGPNGSGKTTLLRLLSGALRPSQGRVTLNGVDVWTLPRRLLARRMAVVPQETRVAFDFTALEIALMGRHPHLGVFELEGPRDLAIAHDALTATGTDSLAERPFMTLSGGEKQRVIIASALAQLAAGPPPHAQGPPAVGADSQILLLDEPTSSLDLAYQLEVASILRRLNRERHIAIVISTHDLNFAAGLCREVILLRDGQIVASGNTQEVVTQETVARLYGVHADVRYHDEAGHLTVVPLGRI